MDAELAQTSGKPLALLLMGPTAAGKTALALELAERFPIDIISVDSALVYRGMDIGTAKPDARTLARYPHRLIDIRDPSEAYSAAEFRRDAMREVAAIHQQGRIPLLVGGTMLYYKILLSGMASLPPAHPAVRAQLEAEARAHGWATLHAELAQVDPVAAARIHPNDPQRLQRALEVYRVSGRALTDWQREVNAEGTREWGGTDVEIPFQVMQLAVCPGDRAVLHQRIAQRFHLMLEQGFMAEVEALYARGDLHPGLPSIRAVGYRQAWDCLAGKIHYAEMVERGIIATRQLAKRQLTWLRGWQDVHWFTPDDRKILENILKIPGLRSMLSKPTNYS